MTFPGTDNGKPVVYVWDPVVRIGHWVLVASVLAAWLTRHSGGSWHEWTGYTALLVVLVRCIWGWTGSHYARFRHIVRGIGVTTRYAKDVLHREEARFVGHNPLGGWMIVALLSTVASVSLTGWLYTTDRFWGVEWVESLHSRLTDGLIVLVVLHVAGVLYTSYRHRENLIAAMIHGNKAE
ncbi:MAG TPA: cytochrome b/b6 domain-containing protein [Woeseiaceae bacterium]|nr:cytochrome b/b6 domain-containing protein [Woeseiaceae bacterium]